MIGGTRGAMLILTAAIATSAAHAAAAEFAGHGPDLAPVRLAGHHSPVPSVETSELLASLARLANTHTSAADAATIEGIRAYYGERGHQLLWMRGERLGAHAFAVAARLREAADDGLDPLAYRLPALTGTPIAGAARRASIDASISFAVVRFATHLAVGRVEPRSISGYITQRPAAPDAAGILSSVRFASDPAAALDRYQPPHLQYQALKGKLRELRSRPVTKTVEISVGPLLRPGATDERVPLLRVRLSEYGVGKIAVRSARVEEADLAASGEVVLDNTDPRLYDTSLVEAVRAFQAASRLKIDGIIGPQTLGALNQRLGDDPIAEVVSNMERWRWMPRDLGRFHVVVNIPEFQVRVVDDARTVHQTRVIVGKPQNQTPVFSDEMEYLVVNPYWNVPVSILKNEMLPAIRANPGRYFARHGYEVVSLRGRGRIRPSAINWYAVDPGSIRLRQRPGDRNALGRIKFMFPNKHAVYLHDTPSKSLFERVVRAFSHGCVRVQDPFAFADALLARDGKWTVDDVERLVGGRERRLNLSRRIAVHLAYFTLNIEDDGTMRRFADIYGHDRRLRDALGL